MDGGLARPAGARLHECAASEARSIGTLRDRSLVVALPGCQARDFRTRDTAASTNPVAELFHGIAGEEFVRDHLQVDGRDHAPFPGAGADVFRGAGGDDQYLA